MAPPYIAMKPLKAITDKEVSMLWPVCQRMQALPEHKHMATISQRSSATHGTQVTRLNKAP